MKNNPVLVLNQNYEPLNVCHVHRAIVLIYQAKAEMLEDGQGFLHTSSASFRIPSVIRLPYMSKRPARVNRKLTRIEIFNRDGHACQYCGKQSRGLTLDHVMPRSRGGQHTWENVVAACVSCNRKKAGHTPEEAGMKLRHKPGPPRMAHYSFIPTHYLELRQEWERYFPH